MTKIQGLSLVCSLLQILGLVLIVANVWRLTPALVGICGFAAVVKYFLPLEPDKDWRRRLVQVAALCGVGMILMACFAG
jgi:membrane-bound ClpP family serine protease